MPTRRNVPPLFNLAWYPGLFWDGRAAGIEEQVSVPLLDHHEMAMDWPLVRQRLEADDEYPEYFSAAFGEGRVDSTRIVRAIGQFLRTLISYRSKYDRAIAGEVRFTPQEAMGYELVNDQTKGDCLHCHTTDANALGTTLGFSNNGLDAASAKGECMDAGRGGVTGRPSDRGAFKIPSFRNLVFTAPYMHDGRFATLTEVLEFYSTGVEAGPCVDPKMEFAHQGGARLTEEEKVDVLAFLLTLSDTAFVRDPAFSNPWTGTKGH
jgi:cytochrome c peroxidase